MTSQYSTASSRHGNRRSYAAGFVFSIILTAIPFWLVMGDVLESKTITGALLVLFAVTQIIVHMIFFLNMDTKTERGWVMLSLIFTLVVLGISVAGSLWIMYHLNGNMMPVGPDHAFSTSWRR
ncbi:cytochrome o ubiquinol oxidase subunit IV [Agrobacterium rosae]